MDSGDWIAIGALVIGLCSLAYTAAERRARTTELELLRRQVEAQEDAVKAQGDAQEAMKRADLLPAHGPVSGGSPHDLHTFFILNGGPAIARAIDVWVRDDESGEDVTPKERAAVALVVQEKVRVDLAVRQQESRRGGLSLWACWRDDTGDRQEELMPIKKHG